MLSLFEFKELFKICAFHGAYKYSSMYKGLGVLIVLKCKEFKL